MLAALWLTLAVSFDCRGPLKHAEKLICSMPALSKLDDEMAVVWRERWRQATGSQRQQLLSEQQDWLLSRDSVVGSAQIRTLYSERLHELRGRPPLPMSDILGEYALGSAELPSPAGALSHANAPVYGSAMVFGHGGQIKIKLFSTAHSHICEFSEKSLRRVGNTFYFTDVQEASQGGPRAAFYASYVAVNIDAAAVCGANVYASLHYDRVGPARASFACALAGNETQRVICREKPLGNLDLELSSMREAAGTVYTSPEEVADRSSALYACGAAAPCIRDWFTAEIARLQADRRK